MVLNKNTWRVLSALACAALLGACTGGTEGIQTQASALEQIRDAVGAKRKAETPPDIVVTRALINQLTVPSLEAQAEARDQTAYLVPFSQRGPVTIWRTADDGQLVLRRGLITSTRGLGGDLVSSDFSGTLNALQSGSGTYARRLFLRRGDGTARTINLSCQTQSLGRVRLNVVERAYDTRHLRETCSLPQGTVVNDYWIEPGSGLMRQSRQWAGPDVGYLKLRVLKSAAE